LYDDPVDPASGIACPGTHDRGVEADVYARRPPKAIPWPEHSASISRRLHKYTIVPQHRELVA
jgi:hypothetical protein